MISSHMITTKGYEVSGCQKSLSPYGNFYVSGRLRVNKDNPSEDLILKWDMSFKPINHEYGELRNNPKKIKNFGEVNHHNMFAGLIGDAVNFKQH